MRDEEGKLQKAHTPQYPVCVHRPACNQARTGGSALTGRRLLRQGAEHYGRHFDGILKHHAELPPD